MQYKSWNSILFLSLNRRNTSIILPLMVAFSYLQRVQDLYRLQNKCPNSNVHYLKFQAFKIAASKHDVIASVDIRTEYLHLQQTLSKQSPHILVTNNNFVKILFQSYLCSLFLSSVLISHTCNVSPQKVCLHVGFHTWKTDRDDI